MCVCACVHVYVYARQCMRAGVRIHDQEGAIEARSRRLVAGQHLVEQPILRLFLGSERCIGRGMRFLSLGSRYLRLDAGEVRLGQWLDSHGSVGVGRAPVVVLGGHVWGPKPAVLAQRRAAHGRSEGVYFARIEETLEHRD